MALGAFCEPVLGNKAAIVADGVGDIVGEIWAFCFDSYVHKLAVLRFGKVFVKVGVEGGAAVQIARHAVAMEDEFVKEVARFILDDIEVGVVAIAGNEVAVFLVPRGVFDTEIFRRDALSIKHKFLGARLFVFLIDRLEDHFAIGEVLVVRARLDTEKFSAFDKAVDADGEVLFLHGDKARIVDGKHAAIEEISHDLVIGHEVFVNLARLFADGFGDVLAIADGVLHKAVDVHGDDGLGTGRDAARAKGVGEGIVLKFVAEATVVGDHAVG